LSIASIGSAYADDGQGPVPNTAFTQLPGVIAQGPVQNAPIFAAENLLTSPDAEEEDDEGSSSTSTPSRIPQPPPVESTEETVESSLDLGNVLRSYFEDGLILPERLIDVDKAAAKFRLEQLKPLYDRDTYTLNGESVWTLISEILERRYTATAKRVFDVDAGAMIEEFPALTIYLNARLSRLSWARNGVRARETFELFNSNDLWFAFQYALLFPALGGKFYLPLVEKLRAAASDTELIAKEAALSYKGEKLRSLIRDEFAVHIQQLNAERILVHQLSLHGFSIGKYNFI